MDLLTRNRKLQRVWISSFNVHHFQLVARLFDLNTDHVVLGERLVEQCNYFILTHLNLARQNCEGFATATFVCCRRGSLIVTEWTLAEGTSQNVGGNAQHFADQ